MSYQPWYPITASVDLKVLGKFIEECGEGVQAAGRCIIQGMDEHNIKENQSNRKCLQDEIADILANIDLVMEYFELDENDIMLRVDYKIPLLKQWHGMN